MFLQNLCEIIAMDEILRVDFETKKLSSFSSLFGNYWDKKANKKSAKKIKTDHESWAGYSR